MILRLGAARALWMTLFLGCALCGARAETVLRFRYWGDIKETSIIAAMVRRFEESHPGVRVKAERSPAGDPYVQKALVEFAGNTAPDVLFVETNIFVTLADKGVLLPLNGFYNRPGETFRIEDYYPEIVDRFTVKGNTYAIPRDIAPVACIYYNKKLFDEAGVPYPSDDWSWSPDPDRVAKTGMDPRKDFLTVCRKLTKTAPNGRVTQFAIDVVAEPFVYSAGGDFADNPKEPKRLTLDDPRTLMGLNFRNDLINKYHVMPSPLDYQGMGTGAADLFMSGKLAMFHSGIWNTPQFRDIKGFGWDVAMFPKGPTGIRAFGTGGSGYGVARTTKHPALAWDLVKYMSGPDGQIALARTGLAQPAIKRLAASPAWLDGQDPRHKIITLQGVPHIKFFPFTAAWPRIWGETFVPELDLVWLGRQTPEQAVAKAQPKAQKILDEARLQRQFPRFPVAWGVAAFLGVLAALVLAVWLVSRSEWRTLKSRVRRRNAIAGYTFLLPWLIGFMVFTIGPVVASLILSFCQWDLIKPAQWVGAYNFQRILGGDDLFRTSLWNTLFFTVFSVPLGVAASMALALLLNSKVKGQPVFRTLYYLPAVTSAVAASVLWLWVFNPDFGLLNTFLDKLHLMPLASALGLVDPDKHKILWLADERLAKPSLILMGLWGAGGGMIIFLAGLQGIPNALYEAADLDGAGILSKFRNVTLPMLTPTIFFSLIMGVIGSFQVFTQALVMTQGGPHNATLFYVLYLYRTAFQNLQMGYASALAWILFAFILAATLVQFRFSKWVYYEAGDNR